MNGDDARELSRLIAGLSDGTLTPKEASRVNAMLRADPVAQEGYLDHLALDAWLEWEGGGIGAAALPAGRSSGTVFRIGDVFRRMSRPALAAAAVLLLVLGFAMGATAWAVTTRLGTHVPTVKLPLEHASFEDGMPPQPQGVPTQPGVWSGDFAEIVMEQRGIKPMGGEKMLRFLRSDSAVEPSGATTYVGDMFQVVELRPWRDALADGTAVVEFSAWFNCTRASAGADGGMVYQTCVWAFSGEAAALPKIWADHSREELAFGSGTARSDAASPGWQQVTARMIVPPDATLLVVELKVFPVNRGSAAGVIEFDGVYSDDASLLVRSDARLRSSLTKRKRR